MKAEVLTIGDELLIGQVVNTNSAWLGEHLGALGIDVLRMVTISDEPSDMRAALDDAFRRADVVITTGGLGPTHDDVTKVTVADYFGLAMTVHQPTLDRLEAYFKQRGREVTAAARLMTQVPEGFTALDNPRGAAPGLWYQAEINGTRRVLVLLPGVPKEMKALMETAVLPRLNAMRDGALIRHKTILTTGIGESNLAARLGDLSALLSPSLKLAYLPSTNGCRLRITARGTDEATIAASIQALEAHIQQHAGRYIFGEGTDRLEAAVGRLLAERGLTVAVAESCTGGLVQSRLTDVPGASAYVIGGVVAYANDMKTAVLGVRADDLAAYGAVSEPVARQMAVGVRQALGTDIGLATTGIMGPGGGSDAKPVGTVWFGYADAEQTQAVRVCFARDRATNKALAATGILNLLRLTLLKHDTTSAR
ncbi:MAG: competence/damage-inducible protein A [Bacteroidota bacterium]